MTSWLANVWSARRRAGSSASGAQIGTAVTHACTYEEERKRAEALTGLDRAKTHFFSNVSHELRTPPTLMLGPVEDALADASEPPTPGQRERLKTAHRRSLRLLKLYFIALVQDVPERRRVEEALRKPQQGLRAP